MTKLILGVTFLHTHPQTEEDKGLDNEHIIVDRKDWEKVISFFLKYPDQLDKLIKDDDLGKEDNIMEIRL